MKEVIKTAASLFLKLIIVNFMCAIVVLSITILANGFFAKQIGYTALGTKDGAEKSEALYTYRYSDGEDTQRAKYEADGYEITEYPLKELSDSGSNTTTAVAQVMCLMLLASFVYPVIWQIGIKDGNLVKFKHKSEDKLKGLKIGLITIIPALALLIFLFAAGDLVSKLPLAIYKLINSSLYGFIDLADGNAIVFGDLNIFNYLFIAATQLVIPVISYFSYILGIKNISISEKIIYKKNK